MPKKTKTPTESDSTYLLKIVLYIILGSFWLRFSDPLLLGPVVLQGVPIGLFIGLLFARHDHFQTDRKVEYPLLIVVAVVSYFFDSGIVL